MSVASDGERELALGPLALVGLALGLAGSLAVAAGAPAAVLRLCAAPLLFAGAWPLLARATPAAASPLKLALYAGLLSPVLFGAVDAALRATALAGEARADAALAVTFALVGLAQLAGRRARVRRAPLGAATWAGLALAAAVAGWSAWMLLRGNATRVSYHGLLHSGLVLATERQLPPANPWLADQGLGYYWAWHALGGTVARALRVAPTVSLALLGVWAAGLSTLALGQLAAVLLRDGRRALLGTLLALLALNAAGGYVALAGGALGAAPASTDALLAALRDGLIPSVAGAPLWDPRLAFGLSKLGNLSSYPASLALLLGGWAAAGHALRHGRRPWVGLTAVLLGASFVLNPLVGAPGIGITALAALLFGRTPRARYGTVSALAVAAVPGALSVQAARSAFAGTAVGFTFDVTRLIAVGGPLVALAVPAVFGLRSLAREWGPDDDRRAVLGLVGLAALATTLAALVVELPYANEYKFVRLAAFPLGIAAGAGLVALWRRGGAARAGAGLWGLATLVGVLPTVTLGTSAYAHLGGRDLPLVESDRRLGPAEGGDAAADDVVRAYRHLATDPALRALAPALIVDVTRPVGVAFGPERHAFTRADNLQAHEAAAFAAVDLWVDRPSQVLAEGDPLAYRRLQAVTQLYRAPGPWTEATRRLVFESERPLVMLVGDAERRGRRDAEIDAGLLRFGFVPVFEAGTARLYLAPGHALPAAVDGAGPGGAGSEAPTNDR